MVSILLRSITPLYELCSVTVFFRREKKLATKVNDRRARANRQAWAVCGRAVGHEGGDNRGHQTRRTAEVAAFYNLSKPRSPCTNGWKVSTAVAGGRGLLQQLQPPQPFCGHVDGGNPRRLLPTCASRSFTPHGHCQAGLYLLLFTLFVNKNICSLTRSRYDERGSAHIKICYDVSDATGPHVDKQVIVKINVAGAYHRL